MNLVDRLRAKVNSTMVPIHLGNGQIINGSGLGSDSASSRLRNEAADRLVEQAARIKELEDQLVTAKDLLNRCSALVDAVHSLNTQEGKT